MSGTGQEEEAGDPAAAFEALRLEVARVRAEVGVIGRAVASLPDAWEDNRPPDYAPDLGRITKGLGVVAGQLDEIGRHPALRLTPEQHQAAVAQAGAGFVREAVQRLGSATAAITHERDQLAGLVGTLAVKQEWLFWRIGLPMFAFVVALAASPIVLGWLPFGWSDGAAAEIMRADRWGAGWGLLHDTDPAAEAQAGFGYNLVKENQQTLDACAEAATNTKKDQRCVVTVSAQ
jgi:hypothetical protein